MRSTTSPVSRGGPQEQLTEWPLRRCKGQSCSMGWKAINESGSCGSSEDLLVGLRFRELGDTGTKVT